MSLADGRSITMDFTARVVISDGSSAKLNLYQAWAVCTNPFVFLMVVLIKEGSDTTDEASSGEVRRRDDDSSLLCSGKILQISKLARFGFVIS